MKVLNKLPTFPENAMGLMRGSILIAAHPVVAQLGIKIGDQIFIGFDGESIRCMQFDWSIEQIQQEIRNGIWLYKGEVVSLDTPERSKEFAAKFEGIDLISTH